MFQWLQLTCIIMFIIIVKLVTTSAFCSRNFISCMNTINVGYPFRVESEDDCGYPGFSIKNCRGEGKPVINISNHSYYVQSVDYTFKTLRVVDVDVADVRQECPHPRKNFSLPDSGKSLDLYRPVFLHYFYNCNIHLANFEQHRVPCLEDYNSNKNNHTRRSSYAFYDFEYDYSIPEEFKLKWYESCEKKVVAPVLLADFLLTIDRAKALQMGFSLIWTTPSKCDRCERSGGLCFFSNQTSGVPKCYGSSQGISTGMKIIFGVLAGVVGLFLISLIIFRRSLSLLYCSIISSWRKTIKCPSNVEMFLENYGSFSLQRYKYSHIKRMTDSFKDELGRGGYGSVFKGMLPDGRVIAVKVLNESKSGGEDFINEVTTIGRTNHVNVVSLLGFCIDGAKRALVYEYMKNGSLERFIYNEEDSDATGPPLGWDKLYEIALGIARGLEYLHRGCNTRILHFDIKPHNILLDEDFRPKISDFGLAKLCPTKDSIVSMKVARGTIGYIAPEVYCRNFGGVSHKSDVYSYGMMVLEMIGGRKNIDGTVDNTSEVYFPQWIYDHFIDDIKLEGYGEIFEGEMARKMIIVALSCVQTHPADRPSISNVVEMLEADVTELQMPPNPFMYPISASTC